MEVVRRVKTPEDAEVAMEVARQYALQRAHRQQHDGLSPNMSYLILKVHCLLKLCSKHLLHSHHSLFSASQQAGSLSHCHCPPHPHLQTGYPRCTLPEEPRPRWQSVSASNTCHSWARIE